MPIPKSICCCRGILRRRRTRSRPDRRPPGGTYRQIHSKALQQILQFLLQPIAPACQVPWPRQPEIQWYPTSAYAQSEQTPRTRGQLSPAPGQHHQGLMPYEKAPSSGAFCPYHCCIFSPASRCIFTPALTAPPLYAKQLCLTPPGGPLPSSPVRPPSAGRGHRGHRNNGPSRRCPAMR